MKYPPTTYTTIMQKHNDDCWTACLASILCQVTYGPEFDALYLQTKCCDVPGGWQTLARGVAIAHGYALRYSTDPDDIPSHTTITIAGGPSPRKNKRGHCVIRRGADVDLHDPHPYQTFLAAEATEWHWLAPYSELPKWGKLT